jgi:probable F420-dependent oxidoreductase
MKYGMQLPVQAQSTLIAAPWESGAGPDEIASVARACDRAGFDYIGVCDHIAVPRDLAPRMSTTWYDTIATLGWLAGLTERVNLLSHVYVVAYRHPLATAKAFSTLDVLSAGRAVLGVGAGHVEGEFDALGVSFAERGATTDDAVRQIRAAFRDEWAAGDVGQAPRPVRPGGPPVWVGGSSPAALRRAATLGDGWLPQGPPSMGMDGAVTLLREHRERSGGDLDGFMIGGGLSCYVGDPDFEVPDWVVRGAPDVLARQLHDLAALGVTHVQLRPASRSCAEMVEQIDAFATTVAPLVDVA